MEREVTRVSKIIRIISFRIKKKNTTTDMKPGKANSSELTFHFHVLVKIQSSLIPSPRGIIFTPAVATG